ncbi:hypothetical protein DY000_02045427 [Brassica cretica]|uniref:Putative plant transposon protein domain-containing protein n=1 Tax=Brassica cretica TaxID=69181 RepID=A0ABQ7EZQ5_BRACR|nr:hypothetical protein DY000_02045427 [Brassica cretica]
MSDQNPSASVRNRVQRFSEIDNDYREDCQFRPRVPFKTFDDRLQESRLIFLRTVSPIGSYSRRHHSPEANTVYRSLCLRGFAVQGSLNPMNRRLDDVFRTIDDIGWSYTVLHVNPFCPRVVREFISNLPFYEDGALVRGFVYRFYPSVINQLMITPTVEQSYQWKEVVLNQAIAHLTGGQCAGWTGFSLNALLDPFKIIYRVVRRFSEIDNDYREDCQFRPRVPFKTFDDRLQESRLIFLGTVSPIGGYSRRHHSPEANTVYRSLCLRGFAVQGSLNPMNRRLDDVFRTIDDIGWSYTVLHVNPFCPRVVREFISNLPFYEDGALVRGFVYRFYPSVINQLMITPTVEQSYQWKEIIYRVCEHSWLPGPDSDLMMKKRLRLMYAVTKRKHIDFGQLVYEQVIDMTRVRDVEKNLIFPNLIYQLLVLQREVPLLSGDEDLIGKGIPICDSVSDGSGPRGRRRLC